MGELMDQIAAGGPDLLEPHEMTDAQRAFIAAVRSDPGAYAWVLTWAGIIDDMRRHVTSGECAGWVDQSGVRHASTLAFEQMIRIEIRGESEQWTDANAEGMGRTLLTWLGQQPAMLIGAGSTWVDAFSASVETAARRLGPTASKYHIALAAMEAVRADAAQRWPRQRWSTPRDWRR